MVNTSDFESRTTLDIETTAYHEGGPALTACPGRRFQRCAACDTVPAGIAFFLHHTLHIFARTIG